jgi:hypothetical protein
LTHVAKVSQSSVATASWAGKLWSVNLNDFGAPAASNVAALPANVSSMDAGGGALLIAARGDRSQEPRLVTYGNEGDWRPTCSVELPWPIHEMRVTTEGVYALIDVGRVLVAGMDDCRLEERAMWPSGLHHLVGLDVAGSRSVVLDNQSRAALAFDLLRLADFQPRGAIAIEGLATGVAMIGSTAFVATNIGVTAVDVSDASLPVALANWSPPADAGGSIYVRGIAAFGQDLIVRGWDRVWLVEGRPAGNQLATLADLHLGTSQAVALDSNMLVTVGEAGLHVIRRR